ncbi:MAG: ProQ/FINO family protein [Methyloceanibacter sp.]
MRRDLSLLLGVPPDVLPPVFLSDKPKPLAVGTRETLLARHPGADPAKLSRWLKIWTSHRYYLIVLAGGHARHDLTGKPVAVVSERARRRAVRMLTGA